MIYRDWRNQKICFVFEGDILSSMSGGSEQLKFSSDSLRNMCRWIYFIPKASFGSSLDLSRTFKKFEFHRLVFFGEILEQRNVLNRRNIWEYRIDNFHDSAKEAHLAPQSTPEKRPGAPGHTRRYTITKLAKIGSELQNSTHSCDLGTLAETTARLVEILEKVPQLDSLRPSVSHMMLL